MLGRLELASRGRVERLDRADAEIAADDLALLDQALDDAARQRRGDGQSDPLVTARLGDDGRVDPHDLAGQIDQRPPRVAGIDRRVGLNERLVFASPQVVSLGRRDDAGGHRMVEAERAADGQHPVADIELVGISPFGLDLQVGLDLEDRQVGLGVGADQPRAAHRRPGPSRTMI